MNESSKKTSFTFPFDTCELPNKNGIAQPWSTLVNVLMCFMVFYYFINSKTFYSGLFIASILLFEIAHAFSHAIHLPGSTQHYITHMFAVFVVFSFGLMLYNYTTVLPHLQYLIIIFATVIIDIYVLLNNYGFIYNILTYFIIFLTILIVYYPLMNSSIKNKLFYIGILTFTIFMIELNEMVNCKWMIERFHFPYHIFVETSGFVAVYLLCSTFYRM